MGTFRGSPNKNITSRHRENFHCYKTVFGFVCRCQLIAELSSDFLFAVCVCGSVAKLVLFQFCGSWRFLLTFQRGGPEPELVA